MCIKVDRHWMKRAITLAKRGIGRTHPNPRVGAVVVRDGVNVGEGWHQRAGEAHAEVYALDAAGEAAKGATIYVTLEPCAGHGRTPPCTERIMRSGIDRVVYASSDPNPTMQGGGAYLKQQGLAVTAGILQAEANAINRPFFHYQTSGMPYVTAKAAVSLDGKLATRTGHCRWITGAESRRHCHRVRAQSDAIIIGSGTLLADNPSLNVRDVPLSGPPPLRVVIGRKAPPFRTDWKLLQKEDPRAGKVRLYVQQPYDDTCARWQDSGADVVVVDSLRAALSHLAEDGRLQLMLEGGGRMHAAFLEQHLAQELLLYQAPCLIGGSDSLNLWQGLGIATMDEAPRLTAVQTRQLGEDRMIRGLLQWPNTHKEEKHG